MPVNLLQKSKFGKKMGKRSESRASHWTTAFFVLVDFAANQMTVNFSRQDFTNHLRLKRVLERHVTSNPFSPFPFFSLCRRTCCVGDVFWTEKNC